jgi:small-conductance mechanosensitive channel
VLTRTPEERVRTATALLDQLVERRVTGPVSSSLVSGVIIVRVADRDVLYLVPADIDQLAGETLEQRAAEAVANLRVALVEADELRTPARVLRAGARALGATALLLIVLIAWRRVHRRLQISARKVTEGHLGRLTHGQVVGEQAAPLSKVVRGLIVLVSLALTVLLTYWWATFSLRQFPYSRPWGESLSARLLGVLSRVATGIVHALPDLLLVVMILAITRILVQTSDALFRNVERGKLTVNWAYPETAGATRRLVAITLWLFGLIVSYPYLPGSGSDAFKGVSVFVGVVISLGSSGIVNQLMSGLTLTYSRALKVGDVVRIGECEGVVSAISLLSVKLRTFQGEEITVPNAVVVGQSTTNYTKLAASGGSYLATSVTIGYDIPWRQVRSLLLLAAERTRNVRREPPPRVIQDALDDFYVRYRLVVGLDDPTDRLLTRDRLHANIQDAFNEFGVQIMSPHYESDPASPKIVPRPRWHARPASDEKDEKGKTA